VDGVVDFNAQESFAPFVLRFLKCRMCKSSRTQAPMRTRWSWQFNTENFNPLVQCKFGETMQFETFTNCSPIFSHNIIRIHNNVLRDWQYHVKYSSHSNWILWVLHNIVMDPNNVVPPLICPESRSMLSCGFWKGYWEVMHWLLSQWRTPLTFSV
jgi:hypothetical protein